jgi:ParB-like chromosome segregation protein Spo0J
MTVEHELIKATGIGKAGGEPRQGFLKRLLTATLPGHLSDDDWVKLTDPARDWVDEAMNKYQAQEQLPEFSDSEEDGETTAGADTGKAPPKQKPTASAKPAPASKQHWSDLTSYKVDVSSIDVGDRIIAPTQKRIGDMIKSLEKAGQIHPILITKGKGDRWKLVSGAARLAAAKKLGWHQIKANTIDVDNHFDLKLIEIEENLGRHDLTDAVRKRLTAMEKKLRAEREAHFVELLKKPPQAVTGKAPKRRHRVTGGSKGRPKSGASEAARKAGIPERTGRRKAGAISGQNENGRKKPSERTKKCPMCHGTGRVKR